MTKKGYTHIIIPINLHKKLKQLASQEGLSMAKLIEKLLSINTLSVSETKKEENSFSNNKKHQKFKSFQRKSLFSNEKRLNKAGPLGFEPRISGSGGQRLIQTRRRAH